MAAATNQELTLHLPSGLIEMVQRAARERQETPDQIVAEAIQFVLQPERQEALRRLKVHIRRQQSQSEAEIRGHLGSSLTGPEQKRLKRLLEHNRNEGLTAEKQTEMQQLFERIEAVATEKAAAIWLLSGKGAEPDAVP